MLAKPFPLIALGLLLFSCGKQAPASNTVAVLGMGPTSLIDQPPVIPQGVGKIQALGNDVQADIQKVFGSAQAVDPLKPWAPRNTSQAPQSLRPQASGSTGSSLQDGYTITFYDLNGVSFAYANHVSQSTNTADNDPSTLAARYDPDASPSPDQSTWQDSTYVTGANTRRTPIGDTLYGFPILYGIYSSGSQSKGFSPDNISRFVMPAERQYWAEMRDGRFFDLLKRDWVSANDVTQARQKYAEMLDRMANDSNIASYATDKWQAMNNEFKLSPSGCNGGTEPGTCVIDPINQTSVGGSSTIGIQSIDSYQTCRNYRFLWWGWTTCRTGWRGAMPEAKYAKEDYQLLYDSSSYWGCGPASGASMLWWWKVRGGKDVIDNDYDVDYRYARPVNGVYYGYRDSGYERAAKALVSDMQAYNSIWFFKLPNKQRATNPWNYASGLQTYLDRRNQGLTNKYKLAAKSHYGWGPIAWGRTLDILKQQFSREQPVVGLEFSLGIQHSGVLKSFNWDPFGDLWADLQYGPVSGRTSLNLSAWWVPIAGVYWIEEAP